MGRVALDVAKALGLQAAERGLAASRVRAGAGLRQRGAGPVQGRAGQVHERGQLDADQQRERGQAGGTYGRGQERREVTDAPS